MFSIICKVMDIFNKMHTFILFVLFVFCCYSYAACPSLTSTVATNITCKYDNKTLENCINPIEGTMACLSCNEFYEENTIEDYPCRFCKNDSWSAPIPSCYPICGKRRPKQHFQDGNENIALLEYPWHVGVYSKNKTLMCSGTLIEMNVVLTDGGCFKGYNVFKDKKDLIITETVTVVSGKNYPQYFDKRDKFSQYSNIHKIYELEDSPLLTLTTLVAILILADPFLPSQVVQPVCIDYNLKFSYETLENGLITSWNFKYWNGFEFTSQLSEVLQEIPVKFIQFGDLLINSSYNIPAVFYQLHTNYALIKIESSCENDTKGGVVFWDSNTDRYYLTGVNSIQPEPVNQNCKDLENYNVYFVIHLYLKFLESFNITSNVTKYCALTSYPQHGKYVFINGSDELAYYEPGYPVLPFSELTLICNSGYKSNISSETRITCSEYGEFWTPALEDCIPDPQLVDNKSSKFNYNYIILIVAVIIISVVALIAVILLKLKLIKKKKLRRELKKAGLDCFQYGNLKRFNPELGIDDQAELLPYNTNYEFPRNKLELGQQLGSGAFGIVLKAEAFGIILNEEKTTVAVKTVKSTVDDIHMKALVSELKIMIHLGQHLNVVNLLGACTQNIIKRELLVIVEYCRFGNLYNYLLQNRSNYIDQIDSLTGNIDYSVGLEDLKSVAEVYNSSRTSQESDLNNFSSLNSIKNGVSKLGNNLQDSNKLFYTKDLVSWSFQIARGMEYLASRKIFHGDLAARNILLAENNIVKICDFGLAKRIYRTTNYKKNKDIPLPIKWMAIESIRDLIFSTQSDVWSYGIVLWELFSLAQTPYPGMEPDDQLYQKLLKGYRMESPSFAPKELYKIMCDCWNSDPLSRPCFNKLAGTVGLLLEENIRQFYIDLNDPYFVMNTQRLTEDKNDYLVMLSAPDAIETEQVNPTDPAENQD